MWPDGVQPEVGVVHNLPENASIPFQFHFFSTTLNTGQGERSPLLPKENKETNIKLKQRYKKIIKCAKRGVKEFPAF